MLYNLKRRYSHWMIYVSHRRLGGPRHPRPAMRGRGAGAPLRLSRPLPARRPTRGSSASPSTPTSGCPSTPHPWWRPTRGSGAPRPPLTSTPSLTTPTTTCCAVRGPQGTMAGAEAAAMGLGGRLRDEVGGTAASLGGVKMVGWAKPSGIPTDCLLLPLQTERTSPCSSRKSLPVPPAPPSRPRPPSGCPHQQHPLPQQGPQHLAPPPRQLSARPTPGDSARLPRTPTAATGLPGRPPAPRPWTMAGGDGG